MKHIAPAWTSAQAIGQRLSARNLFIAGTLCTAVILTRWLLWPGAEKAAQKALDYAAELALFVLALILIDRALAPFFKPARHFSEQLYIGAFFGLLSGLVGGLVYAYAPGHYGRDLLVEGLPWTVPHTWDARADRIVRVVVIATLTNGFLHLVEQIFLLRHSLGHRRREALGVLLAVVAGIVLATFIAARTPDWVGWSVSAATGGIVDWIGVGTCAPWSVRGASHDCRLGILLGYQITLIVGVSALLTILYYTRVLSLSRQRTAFAVGGLAVLLAATCGLLYASGSGDQLLRLDDPIVTPALAAMWVGYVGFLLKILTWSRQMALTEALADAFGTTDQLDAMLQSRLGRRASDYSLTKNIADVADAVVDHAKANNWLEELIVNARYSRPDHAGLAGVADRAGVGVTPSDPENIERAARHLGIGGTEPPEIKFQRIVRAGAGLIPPDVWRLKMAKLEKCVCRIDENGSPAATGFLVGPDLVLTNHHVVKDHIPNGSWPTVTCRFDYKGEPLAGVRVALSSTTPCVSFAPPSAWDLDAQAVGPGPNELDYALLRLAEPVGTMPLGPNPELDAPTRGWIELGAVGAKDIAAQLSILLLQHPQGGPLKMDIGAITDVIQNGLRVRHSANTLEGSSGSPCFSVDDLTPIAIHHLGAGWPDKPGSLYNQAISLKLIIERLVREGDWLHNP